MKEQIEVSPEVLRASLDGWKALQTYPPFVELERMVNHELDRARDLVESGEFPSQTAGVQGVLLREQLIGEIRGLKRFPGLLAVIIQGITDKLNELDPANDQTNETNSTL